MYGMKVAEINTREKTRECNKEINREAIVAVYKRYEGVTWYVQSVLNALFTITEPGESCTEEMIEPAIQQIISQQSFAYKALLFQLPPKQKEVLMAICKEGKATNLGRAGNIEKASSRHCSSWMLIV